MKGLFKKISYLLVLMAVTLFMGMRSMPHHHCCFASNVMAPSHAVHFGFGDCEECEHEHDGDEGHSHTGTECFSESHFYVRVTDDTYVAKKIHNMQPLTFIQESALTAYPCNVEHYAPDDRNRELCRTVSSISLRAPPVARL